MNILGHNLVLSLLCVTALAVTKDCPKNLKRNKYLTVYGDYCYRFEVHRKLEFQNAEDQCRQHGGYLALAKDSVINEYIQDQLKSTYRLKGAPVWIGLRKRSGDQDFWWVDGEDLSFTQFDKKPTDSKDLCAALIPSTGLWKAYQCREGYFMEDKKNYYVCQYPLSDIDVIEPTKTPISLSDCPPEWERNNNLKTFQGSCYKFELYEYMTFEDARIFCQQIGGDLAMAKSKEVNQFISDKSGEPVWIGLKYNALDDVFNWVDGTTVTYSNFRRDEFHKWDKDECVVLMPYESKWESLECANDIGYDEEVNNFVCEYTPVLTDTTTTTEPIQITTTEEPTTAEPTTEEPNTEEPATEEPNTEEPTTEEPTTEEPTTEEPTTEELTTEEPTTEELSTGAPASVGTTTDESTTVTCAPFSCNLDCAMDGYAANTDTGCLECRCNAEIY